MNRQKFHIIKALIEEPKTFWELIGEVDGTIKDLFNNLKELEQKDELEYAGDQFILKNKEKHLNMYKKDFDKELEQFNDIAKARPSSSMEFFQGPIVHKDLFKRIKFIYDRGDLAGKDFFILGDDDLLSIALALTKLPGRITVVEIDKRITDLIKEISLKMKLNIEILEYNCTDPLPEEFAPKFDVFVTDPVETEKGFSAFMSRGVQALKHPGAVYFGLTELECSPATWHKIQKDINDMNLIITDALRKFCSYIDDHPYQELPDDLGLKIFKESPFTLKSPTIDWYYSSFIRLQTVDQPKPLYNGKIKFDDSFYKNDNIMTTL